MAMPDWEVASELVDYQQAVERMEKRAATIRSGDARELLWLLEHEPLYTAGRSAKSEDLLASDFPVYEAARGGQYTYHGPGQRIIYTMLDLKTRMREPDVRRFVWLLEEWIIRALSRLGVKGERREGRIGIWVVQGNTENKIAAIGIKLRQWVSFHGIAINIAPELSHYRGIVPCGIQQYGVTSLKALGIHISMAEFDDIMHQEFEGLPW
jgi:lipoyl(octanoyl) transferase